MQHDSQSEQKSAEEEDICNKPSVRDENVTPEDVQTDPDDPGRDSPNDEASAATLCYHQQLSNV